MKSRRTPGRFYGVVYVERFSGGFVIPFESDGQFQDEASNRSQTVFSRGEIWIRRGAQTIRAQAKDIERLESEFRQREQGEWLNQHFRLGKLIEELNSLRQILNGPQHGELQSAPAMLPGFLLPTREALLSGFAQLRDRFTNVLTCQNDILILRWIQAPRLEIMGILEAPPQDKDQQARAKDFLLSPLLDSLAIIAITCAEFSKEEYFHRCIDELRSIYQYRADSHDNQGERPQTTGPLSGVVVWKEIILRVFVIGAVLIKFRRFSFVPYLVKQIAYQDRYWGDRVYWAQHAPIMFHRAYKLRNQSFCELARPTATNMSVIPSVFRSDEELKTALAQFDFLQAILGIHRNGSIEDVFPNFAVYYRSRVEDIVRNLARGQEARQALPGVSHHQLIDIVNQLDELAAQVYSLSAWTRRDWSEEVAKWLCSASGRR
jgi:hypothetical protein